MDGYEKCLQSVYIFRMENFPLSISMKLNDKKEQSNSHTHTHKRAHTFSQLTRILSKLNYDIN